MVGFEEMGLDMSLDGLRRRQVVLVTAEFEA
jgi:hypothetical protein